VGGADTETLNKGIADASEEHDLYTLEIARFLGITSSPGTNESVLTDNPAPLTNHRISFRKNNMKPRILKPALSQSAPPRPM
jgi:hypothetical protein